MNNCKNCPVNDGYKPAEAVHEIAEPKTQQPEALRMAEVLETRGQGWADDMAKELRRQHARIAELEKENSYMNNVCAELEAQLEAIGAGGVESLRKQAAAPQAAQAAVPDGWVPCVITYEGQHPEEIAYGPQIMMDRLKKWLDRYFEMRTHPTQQGLGERKDRDTIFFLAGWNGCNEGLDANEQFKKAEIAAQAKHGEQA